MPRIDEKAWRREVWRNGLLLVFFVFLMLVTFLPRVLSLSAHWSSDESTWIMRSHRFFSALETRRFTETLITHHPGVTTTWLGGAAMWEAYGRKSLANMSVLSMLDFFTPTLLAQMRFPIAYLTGVIVLLVGVILYRLFNALLAAVGVLFLAFEPFLLAESRRLHTDALTSEFLFLTILLWLCYLEGDPPRRRYLIFSGFFLVWRVFLKVSRGRSFCFYRFCSSGISNKRTCPG